MAMAKINKASFKNIVIQNGRPVCHAIDKDTESLKPF